VVDEEQIETNLLKDSRIVLKNVELKKQVARLPMNSAGRPTLITVTGSVAEVSFSWKWAVGSNKDEQNADAWVRDSNLTLKGLEFKAELTYGTGDEELTILPSSPEDTVSLDSSQAAAVQKQGGFSAWITKQVQMIIDSLDLHVTDFSFTVEIPPPLTKPEEVEKEESLAIVMAGSHVDILSSGRQPDGTTNESSQTPPTLIQQQCSFASISLNVIESTSAESTTTSPILEPFGYYADLTRSSGQRFSGFETGLTLIGKPTDESSVIVHVGTRQIEAITQLGVMLLAPPDSETSGADKSGNGHPGTDPETLEEPKNGDTPQVDITTTKRYQEDGHDDIPDGSNGNDEAGVSVFVVPFNSLSVVVDGNATITCPLLVVSYKANGTVMDISASACRMETLDEESDEKGTVIAISGVKFEMRPNVALIINEVNEIYIPDVIRLKQPIENPTISFQDNTLTIGVDSIHAELPREDATNKNEECSSKPSTPALTCDDSGNSVNRGNESSRTHASENSKAQEFENDTKATPFCPVPLIVSVNDIRVKMIDGSFTQLHNLDMYLNPNHKANSNDLAVSLETFDSKLLQFAHFNLSAALPLDEPSVIHKLAVTAKSLGVSAGYSTNDWVKNFAVSKHRPDTEATGSPPGKHTSTVLKVPFATISALNAKISWKGRGVQIKDTDVSIKPFTGDANTTLKVLIDYYAGACLYKVPGFISNADVLGINVVDHATSTYGTLLGQGLYGTYMGAIGGTAAIAAVDGVKGAIRAGKASRHEENGAAWQPGDIFRGVVYAAGQATQSGAIKRGRGGEKGNIAEVVENFVVGTTIGTKEYVGENKAKLGAATGGGFGAIAGTMVGGKSASRYSHFTNKLLQIN
jgi:hypothetical protein